MADANLTARRSIPAERLREVLEYDPAVGVFTWKVKTGRRAIVGGVAGHLSKVTGYRVIGVDGRYVLAHRAAFLYVTGSMPLGVVDHLNGDKADNRWCNLRDTSVSVNRQNVRNAPSNSKSGLLGAQRKRGKWDAVIMAGGRRHWIGSFDKPEDAHAAYLHAKRHLHEGCTI